MLAILKRVEIYLNQWSSAIILSPDGQVAISGVSFDCYDCDCGTDGIQWVEVSDAVKHLMVHRTAPNNKG